MASSKTKASVEFNADITGFQRSINTLKKEMTTLNSQLKLNAEQLKGNSNNVELLRNRKDLLTEKLNKTKLEIEAINNKLKLQIDVYGEDSEIVRKTTNELIKIQTQEQSLRNELDKVNNQINEVTLSLDKNSNEINNTRNAYEKLQKTIEEQKANLNDLKNNYKSIVLEQGNSSNEAKELKKQIEKLNSELKENEKSLRKVDDELKIVGDSAEDAGTGGFTIFKGALADLAATAIKDCLSGLKDLGDEVIDVGKKFTSSMSQVEALSGATGEQLEALEKKAKELGSSTKFTASEVADGFSYMALAGWDTEEMLSSISGVLNLATAGNMDLAKASDIVTDYLTAFGLSANDANGFVDQMAYAMSNSNTNVEQLGEAYKNVAATSTQLGYSLEDTTAALMVMANSGIKGGEAGTALSSIMTRLGNNVSGCRDMLKKYGVEVYDSQGNVKSLSSILTSMQGVWGKLSDEQKSNLSYVVAGKTAQSELMTVLSDSTGTFTDYTNALKDCDGAADKMAATMADSLKGDTIALDSAMEGLGISIFDDFESPLRSVTQFITKNVLAPLTSLNEGTGLVSAGVKGLSAALGILAIALGIQGLINGVKKAFDLLNLTMLKSPFVWIAAAIIGVIVILVSLWNNCESFRNFFIGLWQGAKNIVSGAIEGIKNILSNMGAFFQEKFSQIKNGFGNVTSFFREKINQVQNFFINLGNKVREIFNNIINVIANVAKSIVNFFQPVIDIVSTFFYNIGVIIYDLYIIASTIFTLIKDFVVGIFVSIGEFFVNIFNQVSEFFISIFTSIGDFITEKVEYVKSIFATVAQFFSNVFITAKNSIIEAFTPVIQFFTNCYVGIRNIFSNIVSFFRDTFSNALNAIKSVFSSIQGFFSGIIGNIKQKFIIIATTTGDIVGGAFKKVINSVLSSVENVINVPVNAINGLLDIINTIPGISLSKLQQFNLPRLKVGIDYVPYDYYGPVYLDEGERVLTKEENEAYGKRYENSLSDTVNSQSVYYQASFNYEKIERTNELLEKIADKEWVFDVDGEELARATAAADDEIAGTTIDFKDRGLAR